MPDVRHQISVGDKKWKETLPDYERIIDQAIKITARYCPLNGEISILLTNDAEIRVMNKTYRGKDKPTNVLSFPHDEPGLLGDIAMALETLEKEAHEQDKTLSDHFTHLFVHGALHLLGHDHMEKEEQENMESLEIKILSELGIENPY